MKKSSSFSSSFLLDKWNGLGKLQAPAFLAVFAAVGSVLLLVTHAASSGGYAASPQSGTLGSPASLVSDASAIGGQAVKFGTADSGGGGTGGSVPYASALSSYKTLAQSFTASQMVSGNWAKNSNDTQEGGNTCSVSNVTYDSTNDAAKLSTKASGGDCAAIRSTNTVPTKNAVIESKILMPGTSSTAMLDWGSFWTDGANSSGQENWPVTGEVDAVETQFGQSYVSIHCGCMPDYNAANYGPTEVWTTEPSGWEDADTKYATASGPNIGPVWTVVDIAFNSDGSAGIYYNGTLYVTVPASVLTWNTGYTYVDWGISAGYTTSGWPTAAAAEEVQYLKVFTK